MGFSLSPQDVEKYGVNYFTKIPVTIHSFLEDESFIVQAVNARTKEVVTEYTFSIEDIGSLIRQLSDLRQSYFDILESKVPSKTLGCVSEGEGKKGRMNEGS